MYNKIMATPVKDQVSATSTITKRCKDDNNTLNITVRQVLPQLSVFAFLYYRIYSIINISKGMGEAVRCQVYTVHYV